MKDITVIKIHTLCVDSATKLEGRVTHWKINMDEQIGYLFQPAGLNPEDGQPVRAVYLEPARLVLPKDTDCYEQAEVPVEILGTQVTHDASGFTGTATAFVRHPHGCFHVYIQPAGRLKKTNGPIDEANFALTGCSGEKIIPQTAAEKKAEEIKKPSPAGEFPKRGLDVSGPRI